MSLLEQKKFCGLENDLTTGCFCDQEHDSNDPFCIKGTFIGSFCTRNECWTILFGQKRTFDVPSRDDKDLN